MLLVRAVANNSCGDTPEHSIANDDWVVAVLAELLTIFLECRFSFLCFL